MTTYEFNKAGEDEVDPVAALSELQENLFQAYEALKTINNAPSIERAVIRETYRALVGDYNVAISKIAREVEGGIDIVKIQQELLKSTELYKNEQKIQRQFYTSLNPTNLLTEKYPGESLEKKDLE
jgi:hypothetical protein